MTVLCNFRKNYIIPVIICINTKHLVTLYNVIFSNITGILSHCGIYRGQQCAIEMNCIGYPICLALLCCITIGMPHCVNH